MAKFTIVPNNRRMKFLPKHFGRHMIQVESQIYNMADQMLIGYTGGYWEYAETENGTPFAFLDTKDEKSILRNPFSGETVEVDAPLAGMILTSFALLMIIEKTGDEALLDKYDALKDFIWDYAKETDQSDQAFTMLD